MVKSKIVRATAVAVTSFGVVAACAGIAGASTGSLDRTGPNSDNNVKSITTAHTHVNNLNHLSASSSNSQWAGSGDAAAVHNTTAGGATTGGAANSNTVAATVSLTNSTPMFADGLSSSNDNGSISLSGPDSSNNVVSLNKDSVKVDNYNSVSLTTHSDQSAQTGKAVVADNTTGGSATSGAASNSNSATFSITIHN